MIQRPEKEEYYLNIAQVVSKRSTCLKVLIGAIIVKEDQIIATGYVGAPRHTRSSLEHGFCLRQKLQIPSGTQYELCRSVHAEQNAIINSARAGVSLLGGDMYIFGEDRDSGDDHFRLPLLHLQKNDHQRRPEPRHCFAARRRNVSRFSRSKTGSGNGRNRTSWKTASATGNRDDRGGASKLCIGLTGRMASGKGEAVRILNELRFSRMFPFPISSGARRPKSGPPSIAARCRIIGNRLRREGGAGILGRMVRERMLKPPMQPRWVIDGIRNPAEVMELKKMAGFVLVGIESDVPTILARLQETGALHRCGRRSRAARRPGARMG